MSGRPLEQKTPDAIATPGHDIVLTLHAEGAQIYEWKTDAAGAPSWVLREPTATLIHDGQTVGRHYAGPNWEHHDGSAIVGKAVANAPATTASDIPWLKIEVISKRGTGVLSSVALVQRINTVGGKPASSPGTPGAFQSVVYSADYIFLKKK